MKIIEAISDTNIGGAGRVLLNRLSESPKEAKETTVIVPKGSKLIEHFLKMGVTIIEVNGCYDQSFDVSAIREYIDILKKEMPDIVNCHGCLTCRIASWICNVPVRIYTRHCVFPLKWWQKNIIFKIVCGNFQRILSHHVIAVAYAAKDNLMDMGVSKNKITVIVNGVQGFSKKTQLEKSKIKALMNIPDNTFVVGIFARLEEYKGHADFLQAAKILLAKSKNFRFLIVGDGSCMCDLKEKARELKIEKYVIFTGFTENVEELLNITDVNVNCSYGTETSSLSLSEGMSLGIPAIVSEFGGNTYMVKNGKNGFTFPVHDYNALAKRIILLVFSKTLYGKMSESAYKRFFEELNAKEMSRQTYALYRDMFYRHKERSNGYGL